MEEDPTDPTILTTDLELGANKQVRIDQDQTEDQIEIEIRIEIRVETEDPKLEEAVVVAEVTNQTTNIREKTSLSAGELDAPSSPKVKGSPSAVLMV